MKVEFLRMLEAGDSLYAIGDDDRLYEFVGTHWMVHSQLPDWIDDDQSTAERSE